jgi:hypothetical protein
MGIIIYPFSITLWCILISLFLLDFFLEEVTMSWLFTCVICSLHPKNNISHLKNIILYNTCQCQHFVLSCFIADTLETRETSNLIESEVIHANLLSP